MPSQSLQMIRRLLENYYDERLPLGVAFVQDETVVIGVGRPCEFALRFVCSSPGACEIEIETWGAVVFGATFRPNQHLIVQFPVSPDPMPGPPQSFVRLSAAVQRALDSPWEAPPRESGPGVRSPRPDQPPLRSDRAEAELDGFVDD